MASDNLLPNMIREISQEFIRNFYKEEKDTFDIFWNMLAEPITRLTQEAGTIEFSQNSRLINPSDLHFAQREAFDLVSPIVIATVSETVFNLQKNNLSDRKLEEFISKTAGGYGATKELTASLCRHLPKFCKAVLSEPSSLITTCQTDKFRIWTEGKSEIVDDLEAFKADKKKYLFWIDLNQKSHVSPHGKSIRIGPAAVNILKTLVEHLGNRVPSKVFTGSAPDKVADPRQASDRVEHQLTRLHKFSGNQFRKYLFDRWFEYGLGLDVSFAPQYFLYMRLKPDDI